jgi:hypothetical protein
MLRNIPRLIDHLWYPILVKYGGGHRIVEMRGKDVNAHNDMVARQQREDLSKHPRGWRI